MIEFYFGLPRCGKTTILTMLALQESKKIIKGKSKYKYIFTNVHLKNIPYCYYLDFMLVGKAELENAYCLIDEASVYCDNRDYKNFGKDKISYFMEHGHYNTHWVFFSQSYNGYDIKLRSITESVYYVKKSRLLPTFTRYYRIPYGIIIPDKNDNAGSNYGQIIEGYSNPPLINRLFCKRIYRKKYYKYFDSCYRHLPLTKIIVDDYSKSVKMIY